MRIVKLDDDTAVDLDRIVAMRQDHYTRPEPSTRTTFLLRGMNGNISASITIDEVLALINSAHPRVPRPDLSK